MDLIFRNFGIIELHDLFVLTMEKNRGAEIGVFNGIFSHGLLRHTKNLKMFLVDPWEFQSKEEYCDSSNDSQAIQDARYQLVKAISDTYPGRAEILRMRSEEALKHVPDESLDFVYIDANHRYKNVFEDVEGWAQKVRPGGYITGHDFHDQHSGVKQAVFDYCFIKQIPVLKIGLYDNVWMFENPTKETEK